MFENYKIIKSNNEKVLCLYINNNYEFSHDFNTSNDKEDSFLTQIVKYVKNNKINFNGKKVYLILNGIIISSLLLSTSINMNNETRTYTYVNNLEPLLVEKNEVVEQKKEDNVVFEDILEEIQIKQQPIIENNTSIKTNKNITSPQKIIPEAPTSSPPVAQPAAPVQEPEIIKEQTVTIYRSSGPVIMTLEEYVIGVVGAEMPASFNSEALKAQSVVARTYTLKRIKEGKQLSDTKMNQVYYDNDQLKGIWGSSYTFYYNKINDVVHSTKGLYITYNNYYIDALYHSTSNGQTEDPINVWGGAFPYLKSVGSPWDINASNYLRTSSISLQEFSSILGFEINNDTNIQIVNKTTGSRVNDIQIGENTYKGTEIRDLLNLRSADFDIDISNDSITITTRGYGHGVGMSQYGANGMANSGNNYKKILEHYYPNTVIQS